MTVVPDWSIQQLSMFEYVVDLAQDKQLPVMDVLRQLEESASRRGYEHWRDSWGLNDVGYRVVVDALTAWDAVRTPVESVPRWETSCVVRRAPSSCLADWAADHNLQRVDLCAGCTRYVMEALAPLDLAWSPQWRQAAGLEAAR